MDIKYKIDLVLKNIKNDNLKSFSKTVTKKNLELENDMPILLDNNIISSYFDKNINKYCKDTNIDTSILSIHSYNIESKSKDVLVYFNTEDINRYSFNPEIYARANSETAITLYCEQLDDNTIKWYWDSKIEKAKLLDEKNNIITETDNYINYYIETDLDVNKTYTRNLVVNNLKSLSCSVTLKTHTKSSIYSSLSIEERNEDIIDNNNIYASRLSAFSSGVGDSLDCKLFKPDDANYGKKFRLLNKIYGIRASNTIKHHTVKFKYRYKMIGTIDYPSYDGKAVVTISATPISKITNDTVGAAIQCQKPLTYIFDNNIQIADIYFKDLIPTLDNTKATKYKFDITISELKGELTIYSYALGYRKANFNNEIVRFSEKGYGDDKISISSSLVIKQQEYIDYYPPKHYEPLVSVVNGDFEVSEDGKKDYSENAYMFGPPPSVYDKKYYCIIEDVSPKTAYVKFKFSKEVANKDYTLINGDSIIFSSNSIIENDTEYKDFLAQVEEGEYFLDDNRKHTYNYRLSDLSVNVDKYKRFELEVIANTNDIAILEHPKDLTIEDGKINTNVVVSLRAVNNAIAKWEVLIHNGYYYYNQEERYLYSKCVMNGHNMILENVFTKYQVAAKISVEASDKLGEIEHYDITKSSKEDLWLDRNLFFWYQNKIWPAPINVSGKYYDFLKEYIYETEPFEFNNKPTSIQNISWTQICNANNFIDVYAISYNQVYGQWNEPVKLTYNGQVPPTLKPSKIIKLRFVLKPSRMPNIVTENILFSSEHNWNIYKDKFLSSNIYYKKEHLNQKSINLDGQYISSIFDLGDTVLQVKERAITPNIKFIGNVEFYIQHCDDKLEIEDKLDNSKWIKININETFNNLKRYCRFKILLKPNSTISYMNLILARYEYDDNYSNYIPSIGNIRIVAEYNPSLSTNVYEQIVVKELPYDMKEHILIPNLGDYVYQMSLSQKFEINNVLNFSVNPYGELKDEFTVKYNQQELTTEAVTLSSKKILYDAELIEKNQNGVIFEIENNTLEVFPIPQQYAPIIITEEHEELSKITSNDIEPLTNVFFINEDGEFSLYNTEKFESLGFKTLYLQYTNIDEKSVKVVINSIPITDFIIIDNVIKFKEFIPKEYLITVEYKIRNSYCVNYDYENDKAVIKFNKGNNANINKIRIFYETDKESSMRKLENINLNPLYNAAYNGYIYICDYSLDPSSISLYPASNFLYANGKDETTILILIKDKYNNPIENAKANIVCASGTITKLSDVTDSNGIIPCVYKSANVDCIDTIKAIATPTVKATINIVNRKL